MINFPREVILEYITKYITNDYKDNGDWININSVFTQDSKHRMGFNIENNFVHDFKLSQGWSLINFIREYENVSESEARNKLVALLLQFKKGNINFAPNQEKTIKPVELSKISDDLIPPLSQFDKHVLRDKVGRRAWRFLLGRGFGPEHIKKYNLSFCNDKVCWVCKGMKEIGGESCQNCKGTGKNFYYNRIIIPSYENGKLVYFQGRDLEQDSKIRYMNPRLPRLQVVYFYDQIEDNSRIYITEGPFDAMTLHQYSSTCLLSNAISDPQVYKLMNKNPTEIVFVPDYDETKTKREHMARATNKNIKKIRKLSENKIPIGIYRWYKRYDKSKKDINGAGVIEVDEDLIYWMKDEFKEEVLEKLRNA